MPEPETDKGRRDFVRWLADSQRHRSIAMPKPFQIDPAWLQNAELKKAAGFWSFAEIGLEYEPRSLVVSPDGMQVAVGTKSGSVHVARWRNGAWAAHQIEAAAIRTGGAAEAASPGAIRGLLFLDPETLIAGWGNGYLSIISPVAEEKPDIKVVLPRKARPTPGWYRGLQRISRLVPLFDPESGSPSGGNLALAILGRGDTCILSDKGNRNYSLLWQSHPSPGWDRAMGALADGLWAGGRLWLLTTRGHVLTCEPAAGETLDPSRCRMVRKLSSPRPHAPFQRLAACEAGLAVLAADSITFLWFGPRPGTLEEAGAHWFAVPGALDCAACFPYPGEPSGSSKPAQNSVWTAVSTAEPGLRWVRWARSRAPASAAANFAMAGGGSILYLAFGKQGADAPLFLACGTRDHRLLIASVLDRPECEDELDVQVAWLIDEVGRKEAQRLVRESAGLGWWYLLTRLREDFGIAAEPPIPKLPSLKAAELLSLTDRNDLLDLASRLVRWYRRNPPPRRSLEKWTFRLLRRADELGEHVARELAETLYEKLRSAWNQEGSDELTLRSLANFLRKWVFHGHTYGDKKTQLYQVFEHNQRCGRKLDALVYLTRLMRRRFDFLWEASLPSESWIPAVWGLAADEEGALSISSLGDGGLCALDGNGRHLAWELDEKVRGSSDLVLSEDRLRLERQGWQDFARLYRHGPYARSLWLRRLPSAAGAERQYLLVFCLKGWRFGELRRGKGKRPGIYALWLRPVREGVCASAPIRALRVEKVASIDSSSELYGLCALHEPEEREGRVSCTLLAGTSGSWEQGGPRQPAPFVELDIEVGEQIRITSQPPRVKRFEKGERHIAGHVAVVPDAANNRCWAIARCVGEDKRIWVWCGFQDGSIRGYRYEPEDPDGYRWYEGGNEGAGPRQRGLRATGPIWRLLAFRDPMGQRMLAYGTGDGVVGAVSIRDLEENEPGSPIGVFLHLPGESPICGLAEYEDEDGQRYLLAADQGGVLSVFDLNPFQQPRVVPADDRRGYRFNFPGLRVDQLKLQIPVRAIVPLPAAGDLPCFLAGTGEARVHKLELRYPLYSQRRKQVPEHFESLMWSEAGGRSVTSVLPPVRGPRAGKPEEVASHSHQWLRVLAVGDVSLMRFSLWDELRRAGEVIQASDQGAGVAELERRFAWYEEVLGRLVEETYRRRPFIEDLALAIWEEGAKVASCIARRVLRRAGDDLPEAEAAVVECYLGQYHKLNALCTDLCNRWIGVDQSAQSIVLIDSFTALFDWTALALIASDPPGGPKAQAVRDFLVYGLIQYRLSYPDTRVPFETLRVINAALTRAVVNVPAGVVPPRALRIQPRSSAQGTGLPIGFYDIMTMVGDVRERLGESLSYSDPLTTEITRFFSLTLLLLPDCALILGQVVSESRLSERGIGLSKLILKQARELQSELGIQKDSERLKTGLNRFDALLSEVADLTILEDDSLQGIEYGKHEQWAWRFLLDQAKRHQETGGSSELSDAIVLAEQVHVFRAAAWLADLNRPSLLEGAAEGLQETAAWLAGDGRGLRFYRHSHDYLKRLDGLREKVRSEAGLRVEERPSLRGKREIQKAIDKCNDYLRELESEHLFRPQRKHYEQIIRHWHDQLVKLADEAVIVLDIMDRFNRHVYRRSADALMDNIVNLAMQTAPISYLDRSGGTHQGREEGHSLRTRILDRLESFPLISSVFEAGEYLVQNTHFAGALLTIARHYEDPSHWSSRETVSVDEIDRIVQEVARRTGLYSDGWRYVPRGAAGGQVPGTRVVWDLFIQEWATNVVKHSFRGLPAGDRPEGPFLKFGAQGIRGRRGAILLSSSAPYVLSLAEAERQELKRRSRRENEELLQRFFELRERGKNADPHGAGMGLFMIKRLAELWGMEVRLELTEFDEETGPEPPLCLRLSWVRRP